MHSLMVVASTLYPAHRKHRKNSFKSFTFNFDALTAFVSLVALFVSTGLRGGGISVINSDPARVIVLIGDDASMCRLLLLVSDNDGGVAPPTKLVTNEIILLLPATSDNIFSNAFNFRIIFKRRCRRLFCNQRETWSETQLRID